jgi:membrane fusion protein, multidrug efflux system
MSTNLVSPISRSGAEPRTTGAAKKRLKIGVLGLAALVAAAGVSAFGYRYWTEGRFLQSTDDAYVQADYTTIAPKVSGYIAEVPVEDNERVKAGQVLARIDDRDLRTALDQAKADVANAEADIGNLDAQIQLQKSLIAQAGATITADEATVTFDKREVDRQHALVGSGAVTIRSMQQADSEYQQRTAILERDRAALVAARQQTVVLETQRTRAETQLQRNQAIAHQAELNLSYATITSPIDGTVGARSLRVGQYVQAGTQLMAVVPLHAVYVVANYKETQLTHVSAGAPAEVEVDAFPGVAIKGHVDSLAPASGLEFALLPPDNATGNFTKIVQRIPVKIVLDPDAALAGRLRPGMSVESVVDTRPAVLAETAGAPSLAAR